MYANHIGTDAVVRRNRCSHTLRTIFRKSLHVLTRFERYIRKQKCCRLGTLAAAAVLAGCNSAPQNVGRAEPTYQEAATAPLLQNSREAVGKLTGEGEISAA